MRGSAVVLGLKSLASKLHPQLPLGPKESQKLFVALTTSFQDKLDQAYPRKADDDATTSALHRSNNARPQNEGDNASATTLADRHLAAVLTNPLLAPREAMRKPRLNIDTARAAFKADPSRDPVSLLEEYEKKGAATLSIASLCLQLHNARIESLPHEKRQPFLSGSAVGSRILLWLWRSGSYTELSSHEKFRDMLLLLLAREGEEEFLLDCLKNDQYPLGRTSDELKRNSSKWKTPVTRQIISARLYQHNFNSANAALDAFFMFCDWNRAHRAGKPGSSIPLYAAMMRLYRAFLKHKSAGAGTDPVRFDKFLHNIDTIFGNEPKCRLIYVQLCELHPRNPVPWPALKLLREAFAPSNPDHPVQQILKNPRSEALRDGHAQFLIRTAVLLQNNKRTEDADWVISLGKRLYPDQAFPDIRTPVSHASSEKQHAERIADDDILLPSSG